MMNMKVGALARRTGLTVRALHHYDEIGLLLERIEAQIERQERLRSLVLHLRARLHSAEGASVDELTRTIEATMEYEKHYTPEQMEELKGRREGVGEERMQQVQQEWTDLFEAYGKAMEDDLDPASAEVGALARKAASLVEEFTGGDSGITASLDNMYRGEGGENVVASHGMQTPPGLWEYMSKASAALKEKQ